MDESFRKVLPYFQLRYDNQWEYVWLTWSVIAVALALAAGGVVAAVWGNWRRQRHARAQFLEAVQERRLGESEGRLLQMMAREGRLKHPLILLTSVQTFDRCVAAYLARRRKGGRVGLRPNLVRRLSRIRRQLGFDLAPEGRLLHTTRELAVGQRLMVWPVKGGPPGFCPCMVTQRDDRAITAVPVLRRDDTCLAALQPGDRVKVRFWRQDDTEYRFRTQVLDADPKTTELVLDNVERLERIQKRDFYRLNVHFEVVFFPVPTKEIHDIVLEGLTGTTRDGRASW